ncbi:alkaline ceramidase TOD1-like [Bidens hawaiensis]|uniref:alkaline ceramidase TOD1-like n=1 Tax=Bidens hawaiensis TaxID=980011 RepID=UPI0040492D04
MGKLVTTTATIPLLFQSKLLCFSLSYLFISLIFTLFTTLNSTTKCQFQFHSTLFDYPQSYNPHKHPIPTLHSSCNSLVFFSDYGVVLSEIQRLVGDDSLWDLNSLKYEQGNGNGDSFGRNYSTRKRLSYFDYGDGGSEIPCGFFKEFPISDYDRMTMEKCYGVVVVSAIFGDHDKIRHPKGLGHKTLDNVCFYMFVDEVTLEQLRYHNILSNKTKDNRVGAWRIVKVSSEELYENPAMNGIVPKYLIHRLFPNSKYSIWVDAKMQLVADPLILLHSLLIVKGADMAISKHPLYVHTMEEVIATARWKKWWDVDSLRIQIETYCENGLRPWSPKKHPYPSDVPDSAIILRKHGVASNLFSCLLFNELEAFNPRDQLPFAYVRDLMKPKIKLNMFDVEVFEHVASEYRHNIKHEGSVKTQPTRTKRASPDLLANGSSCTKCDSYLAEMWGEPQD